MAWGRTLQGHRAETRQTFFWLVFCLFLCFFFSAIDDENETRSIRPRLDMSVLINELCERDVPEIDREKLAIDINSEYPVTLH